MNRNIGEYEGQGEPKNILVFSDGTGQAGGLRPDQRLSNIYKLYRATRSGPDSNIDPRKQIAYYDAGLGSESEHKTEKSKIVRYIKHIISLATGIGITKNITDCYEYIIMHYEPGDRIYLFGFSRGAYTIRCVAGVLSLCGIPMHLENGDVLPRYGKKIRKIANEAVDKVYNHGAGRSRAKFRPQRQEQARRFRDKYGSDDGGSANVVPYFIGAFDTVAALGAMRVVLPMIAAVFLVAVVFFEFVGPYLGFSVVTNLKFVLYGGIVFFLGREVFKRLKFITNYPKDGHFKWHISLWSNRFYDQMLDKRVDYARHAISIDETRANFKRVNWGVKGALVKKPKNEAEWFKQVWFAGNHSDIGGSYPEVESRLSDVSLAWMVEQLTLINDPPDIDSDKLHMYPDPAGIQHSEVEALKDKKPGFWPHFLWPKWSEKPRIEARGAPKHPSVEQRFKTNVVQHYDQRRPYRPETLRKDAALNQYFDEEEIEEQYSKGFFAVLFRKLKNASSTK